MYRSDYGNQRGGQYGRSGSDYGDDWRSGSGPQNNFDRVDRQNWRAQDTDYASSQFSGYGDQSYGTVNYGNRGIGSQGYSWQGSGGQYGYQGSEDSQRRGYGAPDPGNQGYGDRPWGMQGYGGQAYNSQSQRGQGSGGENYGMQGRAQQYGIGNRGNQGFPGSNFPDQDMRDQGWSGGYSNQGYSGQNYGGQSDWRGQGRSDYGRYDYQLGQRGMYGPGSTSQTGGQSSTFVGQGNAFSYGGQGTQRGQHSGKGPKGYQRSDDRIREEVSDRLSEHGDIDASELEVQVNNGEVTLTGFVDDRQQKRMAEDIAEQISGVKDVHNQLKVHEHQFSSGNESESTTNGRSMARSR